MSIHVALNHITHYRYDRRIHLGPQVVRLRPTPHSRTRILDYSMKVEPTRHFITWQQDPQSNYLARVVFPDPTTFFRVEVDLVADMAVFNPFDFFLEPSAEKCPFDYEPEMLVELQPYLRSAPATPLLAEYLARIDRSEKPTSSFLVELTQGVHKDIAYLVRMEYGVQTPEATLRSANGSCRDSAWLLVQLLRHLGLAARFVSGYRIQLKRDVKSLDGPSGTEVDFADLHAWCEVYLPGAGWIGLDPTSGLYAGEGHIPLACSPEPSSAAPIRGTHDPCETTFEHHISVRRVWEAPRVTLPYSELQWGAIDDLGKKVDADLRRMDVRLTQGGEPTFVSLDDRGGGEWNTEAMGPTKRVLSDELMGRLRKKYGSGGLVHCGQGKWYPGEEMPRWSLNLFWRVDGVPIWHDAGLIASERDDHGATAEKAREFLRRLAVRLGVDRRNAFAAFEDTWYFLWREGKLPSNVDPLESHVADAAERDRLRRVFERGLEQPVGYVLPIERDGGRWRSTPWYLRGDRCYLVQGDSPLGSRLPLASLPWARASDFPWIYPPDANDDLPPLAAHDGVGDGTGGGSASHSSDEAGRPPSLAPETPSETRDVGGEAADAAFPAQLGPGQTAGSVVRTAICAEARHGRLYLFMPPASTLEDYLALVAAVESTAKAMHLPVVLEGYEPPKDPRVVLLRVTPDPGVIEVNVNPVSGWSELVEQTTHLYDVARETRLTTEKFMLDGRHIGTGGGNHFVLGGATPGDSPFLRRPDLLASMIGYWHNHPALSYLFSGLFVGPTCQAPRIDEARNDSVYEIEIAFAELARVAEVEAGRTAPWLVDRLLRNLLTDITGNTHRAEFCIDKLYSPDSPTGRLGLLEMRAFEMPPHARMSLLQHLLMRALVARFWAHPYRPAKLARWGTQLHDRFMLPHFIWDDLGDVLSELNDAGYPFELAWFTAHRDFRFPLLGDFSASGVAVELRMALEPWHVLGEENSVGGTTRYVDSTVERIELRVSGLVGDRHAIACNGRRVPLQPTGTIGEYVAAVRYRAWTAPLSLHPTIAAHAPLVFDLVDTWMNRSLGGCQYHVAHPGGIHYTTFPVNAHEAEARRLTRFLRTGHTPGTLLLHGEAPNPDFPHTLDLRRAPSAL
jgi:uncharacterized protein (DUF2126 family)/transglutaminase-like putative cysteine protease